MTRDYCLIAEEFQDDILSGRHPCSRVTRLAFERQAQMLASPPTGFFFNRESANWLCSFVEALCYPEGAPGRNIHLRPWQVWALTTAEGWRAVGTGYPMFRRWSVFTPKSHGKGLLLASLGLAVMARGGINELVVSAGTTQAQAYDTYKAARTMLEQDPTGDLRDGFGLVASKYIIEGVGDGREFYPVSSEGRSLPGKPISLGIIDELAQHTNRDVYDQVVPALVKRPDSRLVVISNAGFDQSPSAPGWEVYQQAREILEGKAEDNSVFAFLLEADPGLDPWAESTWRQCNWNIGHGVDLPGLVSEARAAQRSQHLRARFVTMHLGWWASSPRGLIDLEKWRALGIPGLTIQQTLREWPTATWWLGIDPALGGHSGTDICSVVALAARLRPDGEREYRAHTACALLNSASETWETTPELRQWAAEDWLTEVVGESIPTGLTASRALALADEIRNGGGDVRGVVVDASFATNVVEVLSARGLMVHPLEQGARELNHPTTMLDQAVVTGRFFHDASPLTEWMAGNVEVRPNVKGLIKPIKKNNNAANKIDVVAAIVDALREASVQPLQPPTNYDPEGRPVPRAVVSRVGPSLFGRPMRSFPPRPTDW